MRKTRFFQRTLIFLSISWKKNVSGQNERRLEVPGDFDMILQNAEGKKTNLFL
jgi:hypothetical protein